MTNLNTDNSAAEAVNSAIRNGNSEGVQIIEKLIIVRYPLMGLLVLKFFLNLLLGWLDSFLSKAEQSGATFVIIDGQISKEQESVKTALQNLLAAQRKGDKDGIKAAIQAYADAQSALAHYDGAAPSR